MATIPSDFEESELVFTREEERLSKQFQKEDALQGVPW